MSSKKIKVFPIIIGILAVCVVLAILWSMRVSDKSSLYENYDSDVEITSEEHSELINRLKYCNDMYIFATGGDSLYFCENYPILTIYDYELEYHPVNAGIASDTDEMYEEARSCFSQKFISNSKLHRKMFNPGGKTKVELLRKEISDSVKNIREMIKGLFSDDISSGNEYEITYYPLFTMIDGELAYLQEMPPMLNISFDYSEARVISYSNNKASLIAESHSNIDYDTNSYRFDLTRNKSGEWQINDIKLLDSGIRPYYELT